MSSVEDIREQLIVDEIVTFFGSVSEPSLQSVSVQLIDALFLKRASLITRHFLDLVELVLGWAFDDSCTPELRESIFGMCYM